MGKDILPEGMQGKLDKLREEVVEQAGKVEKASDHISEKVDTAADTLTNLEEQIEKFKKEKEPKKDEESGKKDEAKEKEPKKDEESGKKDEALIQTTRWGIKNKINKIRKAARKAAQVVKKGVGKAKEVADKTAEFMAEAKALAKEADKIYQDNKDILPEGMQGKLDKLREEVVEQAGKVEKASDHISEK